MTPDTAGGEPSGLPPDDAFSLLCDETRVQILQTLGGATEPLSFTELRNGVGVRQGGNFNYHLEQVVGHFVAKTDDGYVLRQPGRRVVQAVRSGSVTTDPAFDHTEIDEACWWCGSPILVGYRQERVEIYCTECGGTYGDTDVRWPNPGAVPVPDSLSGLGFLGAVFLPAAGVEDRTPAEVYHTAISRELLDFTAVSLGFCPRCSGTVETSASVCENHGEPDGLCEDCGNRKAVHLHAACENCNFGLEVPIVYAFYADTEFIEFLTSHGISPVSMDVENEPFPVVGAYDEEVLSVDPFEAEFTFTVEGDSLTMAVDDSFSKFEARRNH